MTGSTDATAQAPTARVGAESELDVDDFVATVNDGIQLAARAQVSADQLRSITQMAMDTIC